MLARTWRTGPRALSVGRETGAATTEYGMEAPHLFFFFLYKELTYDPAIPLPVYIQKK